MDRNESTNEGGSSPETVIARSSSEEEKQKQKSNVASTSGEYITVEGSSSSLDTLTSGSITTLSSSANDRKKGKLGALKNSLREGNLFKIKKKTRDALTAFETAHHDKEVSQQQSHLEDEKESKLTADAKKKKKKSHSLVRKLSLNKFRVPPEQQEPRHTPEGGNSSRSQSQSSQESPVHAYATKKEHHHASEREKSIKGELKKPEKLHEKPTTKTTTVVQGKSPPLTVKFASTDQQAPHSSASLDAERRSQQENRDNVSPFGKLCSSTLPYALSRWPETKHAEDPAAKKARVTVRHSSDPTECTPSTSSPVEVRRKLSLLEEKRAIFQRRFFDSESGETNRSDETVINVNVHERPSPNGDGSREDEKKKKVRHISVRTFDTFSTFDNTFDNTFDEENLSEDCDTGGNYRRLYTAMAPMLGAVDHESHPESSNNAPNLGVSEKREHLYKILVIGELGAGKTSIIKRYVHQFFSQHYRATIGVDFALKVLNWDPHTIIRLQLWDIAGQERFGNMTRVYYKEAVGAFIVFDVTRSATLDAVVKWKQDLDSKVQLPDGSPIPCVLLANKCDQQKEGLVNSPTKMDEYCKEKNFSGWFETSAKENINIEEAAKFLVNKILQNDQVIRDNGIQEQTDNERFALNQSPTSSKKSCSC
ncbi:uncharacterized protein Rab32 isoform X1 [Cardiocondyla obscurior]|uniref:uncharacterized protein Rab32 isoform X1 n=1 Tax=Cardiocondyla obscurior TaxID=286306 RepID=UPI00396560AD